MLRSTRLPSRVRRHPFPRYRPADRHDHLPFPSNAPSRRRSAATAAHPGRGHGPLVLAAACLRLLPRASDPMLVDEQLPRDQARARAAGLVEVRDHLQHLLHSNLVHLPLRPIYPRSGLPRLASQSNPAGWHCPRWGPAFGPLLPLGGRCWLPSPISPPALPVALAHAPAMIDGDGRDGDSGADALGKSMGRSGG
jgi:hypothetical protein